MARDTLLDHAPLGKGDFYFELEPPEAWFVDLPNGIRCKTHRIGVGAETTAGKEKITTASAVVANKVVTLVVADLERGTLEVVIEEAADGSIDLSILHDITTA